MLANKCLLVIVVLGATLLGCSGSPVHTSKLSPDDLRRVSDYTLCHGAASTSHYRPHQNVTNEVIRRQLDCSLIYTTPLPRRSEIDVATHHKKLDGTWVWCKDSSGCMKAVEWMKQNSEWEEGSIAIKNYQLTLERAINFHHGNMTSIIGSKVTKTKTPFKLELNGGVFFAKKLTREQAESLDMKDDAVSHELPAPTPTQERKS